MVDAIKLQCRPPEDDYYPLQSSVDYSYPLDRYTQENSVDVMQQKGFPLKVITVNTYLLIFDWREYPFRSPDPKGRAQLLVDWLKEQNADVILFQETIGEGAYQFLKEQLGEEYDSIYIGESSDLTSFSRFPIVDAKFYPTRWQGSEKERCLLLSWFGYRHGFSTFKIDFYGTEVFFANVHAIPRHSYFPNAREPSDIYTPERFVTFLEAWDSFYQECLYQPCVLGGDFNFGPNDEESPFFDQLFGLTNVVYSAMMRGNYQGKFSTYTPENDWVAKLGEKDWFIIDHIFINHRAQVMDASIVEPPEDFSDHWPIVSTLTIDPTYSLLSQEQSEAIPIPMTLDQIRELIRYIENVDLHWSCDMNSDLKNQIPRTLDFLRTIEQRLLQQI